VNILWPLLRLRIRRDRLQLPVWIAVFFALAAFVVVAVDSSFGTTVERQALMRIAVGSPTILIFRGEPQGADADAVAFFLIFAFLATLAAFMSTFLAVRHTRAEEESGRSELIAATPAGRLMPLLATAVHGIGAALAAGLAVTLGLLAAGLAGAGSITTGAAVAGTGVAFLGVGLLAGQVMRTSRGANGLGAALIGLAYTLRAVGDAGGTPSADGLSMTSAWPSWLSPIGWGQQTEAFTTNRPAPLLLDLALAVALFAVVVLLQSRRDLGSSLIGERPGPERAPRTLAGSLGLAWRLQRAPMAGWALAGLAFGVLAGTLGETVVDLVESSPQIGEAFARMAGGRASIIDQYTDTIFGLVGVIAAAAAAQALIRLRQEEANGSAELLLALPLRRVRWLFDYLVVGTVSIALVLLVAVGGAAAGLASSSEVAGTADTVDRVASAVASGVAQAPAALLVLAIAALLFAFVPRLSTGLSWGVLLGAAFIGEFGQLFGLSEWLLDLSPFTHTPTIAAADVDWSGAWWMLGLALAGIVVAGVGIRRRDLAL
jgi:ABC-2 type transport system permease protein